LNSLAASIESGSTPDNILVFVPKNDEEAVNSIKELVEKVCQEYEIEPDIEFTTTPSISKPQEASQHVVEKLRDGSDEDTKAVSISSGSRLLNACLIAASDDEFDREQTARMLDRLGALHVELVQDDGIADA